MAVSSTPRSTQGSMGQVSGFSQLPAMVGLRDEVQEDVVDDADTGEEKQDPGEGGGWLASRDRITRRSRLRNDAAQPGGREHELEKPRRGHPAEYARVATVSQAKAQVPHLVALKEAGGDAKDQRSRREEPEEERAGQLA